MVSHSLKTNSDILSLSGALASLGSRPGDFPVSERASREVVSLPVSPELTTAQRDRIVEAVKERARVLVA